MEKPKAKAGSTDSVRCQTRHRLCRKGDKLRQDASLFSWAELSMASLLGLMMDEGEYPWLRGFIG